VVSPFFVEIRKGALEEVKIITTPVFPDERGSLTPAYAQRLHQQEGIHQTWQEFNISISAPGTLRGLHFQNPLPQAKLITVLSGRIFDVVVDLRKSSPTFGQFETFLLSAGGENQIYIPEGFAHGLAVPKDSEEKATIAYLVSEAWNPECEQVLAWNELDIPWPFENPKLSRRDTEGLSIDDVRTFD